MALTEEISWNDFQLEEIAELGQILLDQNRDFETKVHERDAVIEEQRKEIQYINHKIRQLNETNESRLEIYDTLEVNIQGLEENNNRLSYENSTMLKLVKEVTVKNEELEDKCVNYETIVEELQNELEVFKTINVQSCDEVGGNQDHGDEFEHCFNNVARSLDFSSCKMLEDNSLREDCKQSLVLEEYEERFKALSAEIEQVTSKNQEFLLKLHSLEAQNQEQAFENQELEDQRSALQSQVYELQEQLDENLSRKCESFYEEIYKLEDVREGNLCVKCLGDRNRATSSLQDLSASALNRTYSFETAPEAASSPPKSIITELTDKYGALLRERSASKTSFTESLDSTHTEASSSGVSSETCTTTSDKATQTTNFMCCLRVGRDRLAIYDESSSVSSKFTGLQFKESVRMVYGMLTKVAKNKGINLLPLQASPVPATAVKSSEPIVQPSYQSPILSRSSVPVTTRPSVPVTTRSSVPVTTRPSAPVTTRSSVPEYRRSSGLVHSRPILRQPSSTITSSTPKREILVISRGSFYENISLPSVAQRNNTQFQNITYPGQIQQESKKMKNLIRENIQQLRKISYSEVVKSSKSKVVNMTSFV